MKQRTSFLAILLSFFITIFLISSVSVFAQANPSPNVANPGVNTTCASCTTSGVRASGFQLDIALKNPLKIDNIKDAVRFFVNTLIKIAIPFIVVFFIWAGLKFILARGNPKDLEDAKKMFWYTIIGTLLILGAWTITNAIIGTVNSITS